MSCLHVQGVSYGNPDGDISRVRCHEQIHPCYFIQTNSFFDTETNLLVHGNIHSDVRARIVLLYVKLILKRNTGGLWPEVTKRK